MKAYSLSIITEVKIEEIEILKMNDKTVWLTEKNKVRRYSDYKSYFEHKIDAIHYANEKILKQLEQETLSYQQKVKQFGEYKKQIKKMLMEEINNAKQNERRID